MVGCVLFGMPLSRSMLALAATGGGVMLLQPILGWPGTSTPPAVTAVSALLARAMSPLGAAAVAAGAAIPYWISLRGGHGLSSDSVDPFLLPIVAGSLTAAVLLSLVAVLGLAKYLQLTLAPHVAGLSPRLAACAGVGPGEAQEPQAPGHPPSTVAAGWAGALLVWVVVLNKQDWEMNEDRHGAVLP